MIKEVLEIFFFEANNVILLHFFHLTWKSMIFLGFFVFHVHLSFHPSVTRSIVYAPKTMIIAAVEMGPLPSPKDQVYF